MDKELKQFVKEGINRYKEASRLMALFGKMVENELQRILGERRDWGKFKLRLTGINLKQIIHITKYV